MACNFNVKKSAAQTIGNGGLGGSIVACRWFKLTVMAMIVALLTELPQQQLLAQSPSDQHLLHHHDWVHGGIESSLVISGLPVAGRILAPGGVPAWWRWIYQAMRPPLRSALVKVAVGLGSGYWLAVHTPHLVPDGWGERGLDGEIGGVVAKLWPKLAQYGQSRARKLDDGPTELVPPYLRMEAESMDQPVVPSRVSSPYSSASPPEPHSPLPPRFLSWQEEGSSELSVVSASSHEETASLHSLAEWVKRYPDSAEFLSSEDAPELMAFVASLRAAEVAVAVQQLMGDGLVQGELRQPARYDHQRWSRTELWRFISTGLSSAAEIHIFLLSLRAGTWEAPPHLAATYGLSMNAVASLVGTVEQQWLDFAGSRPLDHGGGWLSPVYQYQQYEQYQQELGVRIAWSARLDVPALRSRLAWLLARHGGQIVSAAELNQEAAAHMLTLHQELAALEQAEIKLIGLRLFGRNGTYLQQEWLDELRLAMVDSPRLAAVFLSQVLHLGGLSTAEFARMYTLSPGDVLMLRAELKQVLQPFYKAKLTWLEQQPGGLELQASVRLLNPQREFDSDISAAYAERTVAEIIMLIQHTPWFRKLFGSQDIPITKEQYELFEDQILSTKLRQELFASTMVQFATSVQTPGALAQRYGVPPQVIEKLAAQLILELVHIMATDTTPFAFPAYHNHKRPLSVGTIRYYQTSMQLEILHQHRTQDDWIRLIARVASQYGFKTPITAATVMGVRELEAQLVKSRAQRDVLLMMVYHPDPEVSLKQIAIRWSVASHELQQWLARFEARFNSEIMGHDVMTAPPAEAAAGMSTTALEWPALVMAEYEGYLDDLSFNDLNQLMHTWYQHVHSRSLYPWDSSIIASIYEFTSAHLDSTLAWEVFLVMILGLDQIPTQHLVGAQSMIVGEAFATYRDLSYKFERFLSFQLLQLKMNQP